jgi:hypothetical protein
LAYIIKINKKEVLLVKRLAGLIDEGQGAEEKVTKKYALMSRAWTLLDSQLMLDYLCLKIWWNATLAAAQRVSPENVENSGRQDPEENSAELAANLEDSWNQRGLYFPRRAHRTTTVCPQ